MIFQKYFSPEAAAKAGMDPTRFPQTDDEVQKAEETIARELNKLSIEEHEKIIFDIHGIATTITTVTPFTCTDCDTDKKPFCFGECDDSSSGSSSASAESISSSTRAACPDSEEDASFLQKKLAELDLDVKSMLMDQERIPFDAYLKAKKRNEDYVTGRAFRVMCLRAERMEVKSAAELVLQHFQVKQELFGDGDVLGREVRLSDLSADEKEILKLGDMQVLPTRDAAGRTILVYRCRKYSSLESLVRQCADCVILAVDSRHFIQVALCCRHDVTGTLSIVV